MEKGGGVRWLQRGETLREFEERAWSALARVCSHIFSRPPLPYLAIARGLAVILTDVAEGLFSTACLISLREGPGLDDMLRRALSEAMAWGRTDGRFRPPKLLADVHNAVHPPSMTRFAPVM